jgi:starch phosphorylase
MSESNSLTPTPFNLPQRLRRLSDLAYNLWWTWNRDAEWVFRRIDPETWEEVVHNPVTFLRKVPRPALTAATRDLTYLNRYDDVVRAFDAYMQGGGQAWYPHQHGERMKSPIGYFSTEFGLHESLPIYAGGLGILSGDHLKEASDLGMPMVAVGFLYTQGYFKQRISEDGWQESLYSSQDFNDLPVHPVVDQEGAPLTVGVDLPGRHVQARLWRIQVGRVPLFLLDSNIEENEPIDRDLATRLYTSDMELRLAQEILLGLGGVRALRAVGYNPAVWHMNEGHSAFQSLERLRELVAAGHTFEAARERIRRSTIFTTHTPVPAGHDAFPLWLIDKYFSSFWPELGLDREGFIDLARHREPWAETFNMAILAIHMSERLNGVSELHGRVAQRMWSFLWPERPVEEVPIQHITNGIHTGAWLAHDMKLLFDRYLPRDWEDRVDEPDLWRAVEAVPDDELWIVRKQLKRRLVAVVRERARRQWQSRGAHPSQILAAGVLLDPDALTIGFARRFATYKRAGLFFRDMERVERLIQHPRYPVQVIFAGKAHPADDPGKHLIQEVYNHIRGADAGGRLAFLEDYDIDIARHLVQGVDVWLNTPRRPNEACGTSGQKAGLNGALNLSILDGWWREGYNGHNGWAIGKDLDPVDGDSQDDADAAALYDLLENEVVPLYYVERSADDLPGEWLRMVKESIRTLAPAFSMRRMVKDYIRLMYHPAQLVPQEA